MQDMAEIPQGTVAEMKSLCMQGEKLAKIGDYVRALEKYNEALTLVPRPRKAYSEATWIYAAIGEAYYNMKDYKEAGKAFFESYSSQGGDRSAQICLRLGQCLEECSERKRAHEYLRQALDMEGAGIFADENPKYYRTATAKPYELEEPQEKPRSHGSDVIEGEAVFYGDSFADDENSQERESFIKRLFSRFKNL